MNILMTKTGSFPFVPPPSLVGAYYLQPPDAGAIFLQNDLLCNGTCSVTGGAERTGGGGRTNGKSHKKPNVQPNFRKKT